MNKIIFFILVFLFSDSQGSVREKAWRETGYRLHHFFFRLSDEKLSCHGSKKLFGACLLALNRLIFKMGDESYHLWASDSGILEVVPSPEEDRPETREEMIESLRQQKKFFHRLFQESPPDSEELNRLIQDIRVLVEKKMPDEDQAFHAGQAHNLFLKEVFDSHTSLVPRELRGSQSKELIGFGFGILKYETTDKTFQGFYVIDPYEGFPAYNAGLRRGDMILAIDGVGIQGLPFEEVDKKIRVPEGAEVVFSIQSFCYNKKRDVPVTSDLLSVSDFTFFKKAHRFININREEEASGCPSTRRTDHESSSQALYLSLNIFDKKRCEEFVDLQMKDLSNPSSLGMIIDLRNNRGGSLSITKCMLESLIYSVDTFVNLIPVRRGEVLPDGVPRKLLFSARRFLPPSLRFDFQPDNHISLPVYNKNIVVLVNEKSSSASEIFAGTVQDMKRGWVVGRRTAGKGNIQVDKPYYGESDQNISHNSLVLSVTQWVYTLNSGRSLQILGVTPDFHVSKTGQIIENDSDDLSREASLSNSIQFESEAWEQNRPTEAARLEACIYQNGKMGENLKKRIREEEKYNRPFVTDYQLELAKDILSCLPPRELFMTLPGT